MYGIGNDTDNRPLLRTKNQSDFDHDGLGADSGLTVVDIGGCTGQQILEEQPFIGSSNSRY